MEPMVFDWSDVVMKRDDYGQLLDAIMERNYRVLYAGLKKVKNGFNHDESYQLCSAAIESGCTLKAFETILEHCKPTLEEFVNYRIGGNYILYGYEGSCGGLVQEAAWYVRSDVLEYMLDHGCSANARSKRECSALEAALGNGAYGSVCVLERRDDVDFTVTETILSLWGTMGQNAARDSCFRMIAGRLLGEGKGVFHREIPLLPGMTLVHAARHENWPLVIRMCREQVEVTEKQCREVLERYWSAGCIFDPAECAELLDALFTACPGLLRKKYPRYLLALCMLQGEEKELAQLRPWVERMPGRSIVLCERVLAGELDDMTAYLHLWDERMGPRLRPVLHRSRELPIRLMVDGDRDDAIRALFRYCTVRGKPPEGSVSRLTAHVLHLMSPALLAELLETETLFPQEDASALLRYCETMMDFRRQEKRNILLAYLRKDIRYEI